MGIRASCVWITAACALSFSCGSTSNGGSAGAAAGTSASGAGGHGGTGQSGGATAGGGANPNGGSNPSGGANAGASQGGTAPAGGGSAGQGSAGQAGASDGGTSNGGSTADGGAAGQSEQPPLFEPWALWPMPNPASAGLPHPAQYDTSKAGVVLDKVTGLTWQATVSTSTYAWADAKAYCASLSLGGFKDWRLPSRIELVSIVDFTIAKPGPVLDPTACPSVRRTPACSGQHRRRRSTRRPPLGMWSSTMASRSTTR